MKYKNKEVINFLCGCVYVVDKLKKEGKAIKICKNCQAGS